MDVILQRYALDNIIIKRFWRALKYGEVYLKDYESPIEAVRGISKYIDKYNSRRPHDSLGRRTPDEVYFEASCYGENQIKVS